MRKRSTEYSPRFFDGTDLIKFVRFQYLFVIQDCYFQTGSRILRLLGFADVEHLQIKWEEWCWWRLLCVPQIPFQETQVLVASKLVEGFCSSLGRFGWQFESVFGAHEM